MLKSRIQYRDNTVTKQKYIYKQNATESSKEVWGSDLAYLKSTKSEGDASSPDFRSRAEFSLSAFNNTLKQLDTIFKPSDTISIKNITYTTGGRVKTININGTSFSGTDIRSAFLLNSADFIIKQDGDKIIFTVEGKGHGVGMSQYGANYLAKNGYDYIKILKHYYNGVEIMNKY